MSATATLSLELVGEQSTLDFGRRLGQVTQSRGRIFLYGELGAGKTTLARGLLYGLGVEGKVKSPTYTLMEIYNSNLGAILHLDLYRLSEPEELEFLAIRDYCSENTLCLVEWPDRAAGFFPKADLEVHLGILADRRLLRLYANGERGQAWCSALTGEG